MKKLVKSAGRDSVLDYLKDEALRIESETKVFFLFQALHEAALSAERFFFGSDMEDKAADLLLEAAGAAHAGGAKMVEKTLCVLLKQKPAFQEARKKKRR